MITIIHEPMEHQPAISPDTPWPVHSTDASGKWYRPAGRVTPNQRIYPLFNHPTKAVGDRHPEYGTIIAIDWDVDEVTNRCEWVLVFQSEA